MNELLGWAASVVLAISSLPQCFKTVRDGHADGLSWAFIALWLIGEILSLAYVLPSMNWPLIANYGANLAILLIIGYYKMFSRFSRTPSTLTREERMEIINQIQEVQNWKRNR